MTATQKFKGDAQELKFEAVGSPILTQLEDSLDDFFEGAYDAMNLGDVLHELGASPLARAIKKSVFRQSFNAIFENFVSAGSFESYLTVFRKIFGEDVEVEFTVPAPGKLLININATLESFNFVARTLVSMVYVFDNVIYEDGDGSGNILFEVFKGFESQYELEQMLYELVPGGIFTDISLTLGD